MLAIQSDCCTAPQRAAAALGRRARAHSHCEALSLAAFFLVDKVHAFISRSAQATPTAANRDDSLRMPRPSIKPLAVYLYAWRVVVSMRLLKES